MSFPLLRIIPMITSERQHGADGQVNTACRNYKTMPSVRIPLMDTCKRILMMFLLVRK